MAVIFLAMRRAPPNWIWAPYLGAFAEAGVVGACADWFAVVALLHCPLGLPIHHTEVVPENKPRIGPAMGRFITNNFLSRASPSRGVRRSTLSVLRRDGSRTSATRRRSRPPPDTPFRTRSTSRRKKRSTNGWLFATQRGVEAVPAAPFAFHGLSILWAQEAGQTLLDQGLNFVETTLARHKATIVKHVSQKNLALDPKSMDDMIAAKVLNGLTGTLREMRDPDHPWREQANALVEKLIDDLAHGPEMRAQGEALKQDFLANPVLAEQTRAPWEELETALRDDLPRHREAIMQWLVAFASAAGRWLEDEAPRRARINRRLRLLALRTVLPRRAEIGAYIAAVVDNWDTAILVNRLELQVGKDLRCIRINGTLVGLLILHPVARVWRMRPAISAR